MASILLNYNIAVWEREVTNLKHKFGADLFAIMDRNRIMGDESGGEQEKELVEIYTNCATNMAALLELRNRKQTELTKLTSNPYEKSNGDDESPPVGLVRRGFGFFRIDFEKNQKKSTLKAEMTELDKDIQDRKEKFGVEMYDIIIYLGDNYTPKTQEVKSLLEAARTEIDALGLKIQTAEKEYDDIKTNGAVLISQNDVKDYVDDNPQLWAMLEANLQMREKKCKELCYRVIVELVTGLHGQEAQDSLLKKKDFVRFEKRYVKDAKGSVEFFRRCLFAALDTDQIGVLDKRRTDKFLDIMCNSGSIFHGNIRLPEKVELKKLFYALLGEDEDLGFTFEDIDSMIHQISTLISRDEIKYYVDKNPTLWERLENNTKIGEEQCKMICLQVTIGLVSGFQRKGLEGGVMNKSSFTKFEKYYVQNPTGSQEFFQRCLFAYSDKDQNGMLTKTQIEEYLDLLNSSGTCFNGE